ncbi:MAG: RICIN domain-containing protein, partial [Saprospiraceae bacterium]|nr:RICIN domain-containing protein [Saprospiraceae bacterium]
GYALELIVDFVRMPGGFRGPRDPNEPITPVASQELKDVIDTWPKGNIDVRTGDYMFRPHQKWTIKAVPEGGGYPGGPYYKILIAGTDRALAATSDAELTTVPQFSGADEQLWRIDQLIDGTFRIMPKLVPGSKEQLALISSGDSTPTLGKFDFNSDNSKWNFRDK